MLLNYYERSTEQPSFVTKGLKVVTDWLKRMLAASSRDGGPRGRGQKSEVRSQRSKPRSEVGAYSGERCVLSTADSDLRPDLCSRPPASCYCPSNFSEKNGNTRVSRRCLILLT